jgi:hypothetical protein
VGAAPVTTIGLGIYGKRYTNDTKQTDGKTNSRDTLDVKLVLFSCRNPDVLFYYYTDLPSLPTTPLTGVPQHCYHIDQPPREISLYPSLISAHATLHSQLLSSKASLRTHKRKFPGTPMYYCFWIPSPLVTGMASCLHLWGIEPMYD